jgi:hypothetical protein
MKLGLQHPKPFLGHDFRRSIVQQRPKHTYQLAAELTVPFRRARSCAGILAYLVT